MALRFTAAAATGRFELQQCSSCAAVQYPPREACHQCLSVDLRWVAQAGSGELIADTALFHSHVEKFGAHLPWRLGLVKLQAGPSLVVHVHKSVPVPPAAVRVQTRIDDSGQAVLIATRTDENDMNEDPRFREMSSDPRGLNVLVTDARTDLGRALVERLLEAGAARVWAGALAKSAVAPPAVNVVELDVRNERSVASAAADFGAEIDILINTAIHEGEECEEMEVNYFSLLRLRRHFGPLLRKRPASSRRTWVNVLSIAALCSLPSRQTFAASMAAAWSFSQGDRAQSRAFGLRVVNVLPGPMAADPLARAIVVGLEGGVEDLYPGELAQEWLTRWLESPKALEREIAEREVAR